MIVLYRLSTSNHNYSVFYVQVCNIVLYRLSTSNHNCTELRKAMEQIVLYRLSTSNHNRKTKNVANAKLSYIVFLHQTTTSEPTGTSGCNCLISSFYIKPQHFNVCFCLIVIVLYRLSTSNHNDNGIVGSDGGIVLYRLSTSNHNGGRGGEGFVGLSYIVFLHQTTTLLIYSSDYQSVLSYLKQ